MLYFIIKIVICSSIFIVWYNLLLAKEKSFNFNRFFLLFALVFSYVVPFLPLHITNTENPKTRFVYEGITVPLQVSVQSLQKENYNWNQLIWFIYGTITALIFIKRVVSIYKIKKLKGETILFNNQKIKVLQDKTSPFSFWKTIYIGRNYFKENTINEMIFLHEKNHIDQKHRFDLFFIELLLVFSWFNPALYFYKREMVDVHEFLADENVLKENSDRKSYQKLILNELINSQNINFTHQFKYNNTKKRFIMMTKTPTSVTKFKGWFTVPIALFLLFVFAEKAKAQHENVKKQATQLDRAIPINKETATKEELKLIETFEKEMNTIQIKADTIKRKQKNNSPIPSSTPKVENNAESLNPPPPLPAYKAVDKLPEFPGGLNTLRKLIAKNFDGSIMNGNEGTIKSEITFVVLEDGNIDDLRAVGNSEKFNKEAIKSIKAAHENVKWKPAEVDGKPVNYIFKMPLVISF